MSALSEPSDDFFASRYALSGTDLDRVLTRVLGRSVDYADLYFEYTESESASLEESMVKRAGRSVSQGVGVRATAGEKTGYAYSDDITLERLADAATAARAIAEGTGSVVPTRVGSPRPPASNLYPVERYAGEIPLSEKIDLLAEVDRIARAVDPRIRNVIASFSCSKKRFLVVTSDGVIVEDTQPLVRLNVACIAEDGENRQSGSYGGGGRAGLDFVLGDRLFEFYAREAARQAILNLSAVDAPAGTMDVVLGPGWPGILLHEAVGHGLEGDFNRKGTSAFSGRLGQKVASNLCTVVDDGTIPGRRGSINVDDEGTPSSRTVLIEKGTLRAYLQDRLNARLMKMPLTGNGRRESYGHHPMPRMTNTFMLAGGDDPEEIIRSVNKGLYAVAFGGGQVDITNGKFVFSASEAYLIENGRVTAPVKGATLIGNGPDVLTRVSRVGNDLKLDAGIGTCGKDGQSVPVGVGLPTIRIDGMTVGGTRP